MPTLVVIGTGPGMGLAVARTCGSRGFDVVLISRDRAKRDRKRPPSSNLPSRRLLVAAREPVTAPTIASVVSAAAGPAHPRQRDATRRDRQQFGMTINPMGMIRGLTTVIATLRFVRAPA